MNPDFPQNEREMLEAKLTALLLGELSADETVELGKAMEKDSELAALYERLKLTIGLVRESASHPVAETASQATPLKLSEERREKLLAHFKTVTPKEFARPRRVMDSLILTAVAAACVMILAALLLPSLSRSKIRSAKVSVMSNLRWLDGAKQQWALENHKPDDAEPTLEDLKDYLGRGSNSLPSVAGETYVPGKVSDSPIAKLSPGDARKLLSRGELAKAEKRDGKVEFSMDGPVFADSVNGTLTNGREGISTAALAAGAPHEAKRPMHESSVAPRDFGLAPPPTPAAPSTPKAEIFLPAGGQVADNLQTGTANNNWTFTLGDSGVPTSTDGDSATRRAYAADSPAQTPGIGALQDQRKSEGAVTLNYYALNSDISGAVKQLADQETNNLTFYQAGQLFGSGAVTNFAFDSDSYDLNTAYRRLSKLDMESETGQLAIDQTNFVTGLGSSDAGGLAWVQQPGQKDSAVADMNVRRETKVVLPPAEHAPEDYSMIRANGGSLPASRVGGFGGGGGGGVDSLASTKSVPFAGGKQVELAAAANTPPVGGATNKIAPYLAAKEQLENEKRWRQVLAMRTGQEEADRNLPGAKTVQIPALATAAPPEKPGLGQKLRETFSGKVERSARITVEQEHPDIAGAAGPSVGRGYDPYFVQTESQAIQSDAVLKKVVENLKLDNGDASKTQEAVQKLKKDLDVHPVKNTGLIEIGAKSEKPEDAARIANAVAEAYRQYRADEYEELKNHGIQSLQQQLAEQDQKVKLTQAKVDDLAKKLNVYGPAAAVQASPAQQADTTLPKPAVPPPTPQPEILTRENGFSTFSLNVSDVSFKLAAASLEKGQMPEPASIRSEEFINAFDYRDPDAAPGVPIAFASERARYPFAQNRELLRFSLKTAAAGRQAGRPLNIVLLLDNSGSMERADRVRIIQEALRVLAAQLQASDTFSIVTFARTAQLRVDGVPGNQAAAAAEEIARLTPEGGTNLGDALDLAYETALHHYLANGDNRVVLLTDGAANLGDVQAEVLKQKVEAHRKQGVALDCFGIGWEGYNDDLLEVLTRNGDGRYGFINTPEEATTEFVSQIAGALHVAAADVKVQVEFNPRRVTSYRQIGYAKHQLTKEQFRDNTVDAAEIAAQEAGNALYTIETNPQGEGSIATVRVHYKVPSTGEYREQAWDVPYTGGAVVLEQASAAMRLAATASAFSEWLATSPFATEVTTDQLLNYLKGVPQVYGADTRPKKLEWMIRQARSISGK